jgi:hypothetical protein
MASARPGEGDEGRQRSHRHFQNCPRSRTATTAVFLSAEPRPDRLDDFFPEAYLGMPLRMLACVAMALRSTRRGSLWAAGGP